MFPTDCIVTGKLASIYFIKFVFIYKLIQNAIHNGYISHSLYHDPIICWLSYINLYQYTDVYYNVAQYKASTSDTSGNCMEDIPGYLFISSHIST